MLLKLSGKRVSKTQITCQKDRHNKSKGLLIPNVESKVHAFDFKGVLFIMASPFEGSAPD